MTKPSGTVWTGNSIEVGAQAADNIGLARLELWGGGKIITTFTCSTTTCTGSIWWVTGALAPGAYQVNAVAVDKAGNRAVSAPVTIVKDATSPVYTSGAGTASTSTTSTSTTSTSTSTPTSTTTTPTSTTAVTSSTGDTTLPTVAITSPASGVWTGNSIMISAGASDNVKVNTIQFYGDGSLFGSVACTGTSCSGTVQWLTGSLASGAHTVTAVATDSSGNSRTSAPITIYR